MRRLFVLLFLGLLIEFLLPKSVHALIAAPTSGCVRSGCSGQICSDKQVTSTCEYREEYACYKTAVCERQANGACGWTPSDALKKCLNSTGTTPIVVPMTPMPSPTCVPRPACLDANPSCEMYIKIGNLCPPNRPSPTPTPACLPRPACLDSVPACKIAVPVEGFCPPTGKPSVIPTPPPAVQCTNAVCDVMVTTYQEKIGRVGICKMDPSAAATVGNDTLRYEGQCTFTPRFDGAGIAQQFQLKPELNGSAKFIPFTVHPGHYNCSFRICRITATGTESCSPWGTGGTSIQNGTTQK